MCGGDGGGGDVVVVVRCRLVEMVGVEGGGGGIADCVRGCIERGKGVSIQVKHLNRGVITVKR